VQAAFRDTAPEVLRARYEAATECRTLVEAMDASIGKLIAAGRGPNFEEIMATLKEIQQCLAPHAGVAAAELGSVPAASPAEAGPASPAPGGFKGAVGSREEVLAALTAVCQYYRRFEPSSPVPFLLTRAQRLVPMDFVQILNDMTPEALEKLKVIIGSGDSSEQKPT
jgi:type VI secretion system protein ImpA